MTGEHGWCGMQEGAAGAPALGSCGCPARRGEGVGRSRHLGQRRPGHPLVSCLQHALCSMFRAVRCPPPQPSGPGPLSASHSACQAQAEPLTLHTPATSAFTARRWSRHLTRMLLSHLRLHWDATETQSRQDPIVMQAPGWGAVRGSGPVPWALYPPHRPVPLPSIHHPWAPSTPWNSPSVISPAPAQRPTVPWRPAM